MTLEATFCYTRLKGRGRGIEDVLHAVEFEAGPELERAGITIWGVWSGLFGVGSNELIVVTASDPAVHHEHALDAALTAVPGTTIEQYILEPTVRPNEVRRIVRDGLYVFRFFDVRTPDVDEIVRLSLDAWTTFEASDDYRTEPLGLFRERDHTKPTGVMVLCTWYDGLASWQASRVPRPGAAENFRRRYELTSGSIAFATQLVGGNTTS